MTGVRLLIIPTILISLTLRKSLVHPAVKQMDLPVILRLMLYLTCPVANLEMMQTNRILNMVTQPHPLQYIYRRLYLMMLLVH